jgi:hypothetical protein
MIFTKTITVTEEKQNNTEAEPILLKGKRINIITIICDGCNKIISKKKITEQAENGVWKEQKGKVIVEGNPLTIEGIHFEKFHKKKLTLCSLQCIKNIMFDEAINTPSSGLAKTDIEYTSVILPRPLDPTLIKHLSDSP